MNERKVHLDFVRGLAAVAVSISHLRNFFFVDYPQIAAPNPMDKIFYFMTGFGHVAVMIFFVLSGYFIGGSVYTAVKGHRWSWSDYGVRRLVRLWTVLIPALLLTLMWDSLGIHLHQNIGYDGRFGDLINSVPGPKTPMDLSLSCFWGNVFFLQDIRCPVFGTNGPLWSLSYEFWYYLLFPLGYFAFIPYDTIKRRITAAILLGALFLFLPKIVLADSLIWLAGFLAFYICSYENPLKTLLQGRMFFILSGVSLAASLYLVRKVHFEYLDFLIGAVFACILPFLSAREASSRGYKWISEKMSSISYTLYSVHFPFLAFLFFLFRLPYRSQPALGNYVLCFLIYAAVLVYGWIIWFLFEKRTDKVKGFMRNMMGNFEKRYR